MSELSFTMFGEPPTTTHHAKKITRVGGFSRLADKPELKNAIAVWESRLLAHRPAHPMKGPVRLTIHAVFTPPKCEKSTKAKAARFDKMGLVPKVSKPDCSNFAKTLEDRLVALGFIEDDKAVYYLCVSKWIGDHPRTTVTIETVGENP